MSINIPSLQLDHKPLSSLLAGKQLRAIAILVWSLLRTGSAALNTEITCIVLFIRDAAEVRE